MRVLFHQPAGWEAEIVNMDGAVHIRAKAPGSTLPWSYVLTADEAMQMAQILEENAIEARRAAMRDAQCTCIPREGLHTEGCPHYTLDRF